MSVTRREFLAGVGAAAAASALPADALEASGVSLGLQTYTFHDVRQGGFDAVDQMLLDMRRLRVNLCELWAPQTEPSALPVTYWAPWRFSKDAGTPSPISEEERALRRASLRAWRTDTPPNYYSEILRRFQMARVNIFAFNYSFEPTMTDAEIEHGFLAARQLHVKAITASSKPSVAKRVVPFAQKYGITVAFHNHSNLKDEDDVATPDSFQRVLAMSPHFKINLDVAHFAAAGFNPIPFLEQNHENILNLHVHDRLAHDGKSVPMGQGVAPVQEVLKLVRDRKWNIPCFYELEYVGGEGRDVIAETQRELDYEVRALQAK